MKLLLVDDDAVFCGRLARALSERGLSVESAGSAAEAREVAEREMFDYAVLDLRLPDGTGLELLAELGRRNPELKSVLLTGYGSIATAVEAVKSGAVNYLTKPVDPDRILVALSCRPEDLVATESPAEIETPTLSQVEWDHIQRVLDDCEGNVSHAAKQLGLHRRSLQRKLSKAPGALK